MHNWVAYGDVKELEREMRQKYQTVMTPAYIRNSWEFYLRKLTNREAGKAV